MRQLAGRDVHGVVESPWKSIALPRMTSNHSGSSSKMALSIPRVIGVRSDCSMLVASPCAGHHVTDGLAWRASLVPT
jgi:hypothetical protein